MTKDLQTIRDRWLNRYFIETANIWNSWKCGHISYREREETLGWYRRKLHELKQGPKKAPILQKKPKRDDEWLEDLKI